MFLYRQVNDLTVLTPHTHPEDKSNVKAVQVRGTLLKRATTSMDQPRQLVAAVAQQTSVDVMRKMGTKDSIAIHYFCNLSNLDGRVYVYVCIWLRLGLGLVLGFGLGLGFAVICSGHGHLCLTGCAPSIVRAIRRRRRVSK